MEHINLLCQTWQNFLYVEIYGQLLPVFLLILQKDYKKIREGEGKILTVGVLDGIDDVINIKESFYHFGIDIEGVNSYIGSYIELDKVPETEGALVLVTWLADYFDMVGEEQPGARVIHYDLILLQEIWEHYSVSKLSISIFYLIFQLIPLFNL